MLHSFLRMKAMGRPWRQVLWFADARQFSWRNRRPGAEDRHQEKRCRPLQGNQCKQRFITINVTVEIGDEATAQQPQLPPTIVVRVSSYAAAKANWLYDGQEHTTQSIHHSAGASEICTLGLPGEQSCSDGHHLKIVLSGSSLRPRRNERG